MGVLAMWVCASRVRAQESTVSIFTETGDGVPNDLGPRVDDALVDAIAEDACCQPPTLSPASFVDVQLTAGCDGSTAECLGTIADMAQVQRVVVRRLTAAAGGQVRLELIANVPGSGQSVHNATTGPAAGLVAEVPALVASLLGDPGGAQPPPTPTPTEPRRDFTWQAPTAAEAGPPRNAPSSHPAPVAITPTTTSTPDTAAIGIATWIVGGAGIASLAAGAIVGYSAASDFEDVKATPVRTRADADAVHDDVDGLGARATTANLLFVVGGAALTTGIVLLTLDLSAGGKAPETQVALEATPGRAALCLRGQL